MNGFGKSPCVLAVLMVLLLVPVFSLSAQSEAGRSRGDYLTLKIAVMGPGDELYFWWGHIALIVEDAVSGQSRFYDYGLFSFKNVRFFVNFAMGRLLYSCGVSPTEVNINNYIRTNRDVTIYTLNLPAGKKEAIWSFVEQNVLPENRDYYYHHFRDNCATRIRDIIDLATNGQFKERFAPAPGRFTLRQHVRRHTWFSPFFDWFLNFLMGQGIDTPITEWEEMFLPAEIGNRIQNFRYTDPLGKERTLVSSTEILYRAVNRPAVLDKPRRQWIRELFLGLFIAGVLVFFFWLRKTKPKIGRVLLGLSQSFLGLFFGIAGVILFFMTFFTNHDYTYHNSNFLYINPLILAAIPLGIKVAWEKDQKKRLFSEWILRGLWTYVVLGGILSMVIKLFPGFYQQNQVTQALVLPFALVLSFIPPGGKMFLKGLVPKFGWFRKKAGTR
ncbi:DUF4105 domain-containing protein [Treponema sp. TIM-1]|uniref:lipoprotein N-acyltransferase Lnb domain-containing protein n=1 Tax=Treponema sp. TIM-1 TaxID=2898417 RepID=UPI00397F6C6C